MVSGGVARNGALRSALDKVGSHFGLDVFVPPFHLCTDNGVMVAWSGIEQLDADFNVFPPPPPPDAARVRFHPRLALARHQPRLTLL